jgi:hypothetical protein
MKYVTNFTILLIVLLSMMPYEVEAATVSLAVIGDGVDVGGAYNGSTWAGMNLDDDDVTYKSNGAWSSWEFTHTAVTPIQSVALYYKIRNIAPAPLTARGYTKIGGMPYYGSDHSVISGTYELKNDVWAVNPATGVAWTAADVNNAQFGVGSLADEWRCSYIYLVVTYTTDTPTVTTSAATLLTYVGATYGVTLNGAVTVVGSSAIDLRGFAWSTTSNTTAPGNIVPPATYAVSWTEGAYNVATYSHIATGLIIGTTYYYRACAHNTQGWAWGDEVSFTSLGNPVIARLDATNVSYSTARLNARVTDSGGQLAGVRFVYGLVPGFVFADYARNTPLVDNTYTTGDTPYADITGLTGNTTYYYRAQIVNDVSTQLSSEGSFITELGVTAPSSLTGTPSATSISLAWVKGAGSNRTLIRYKIGAYPTATTDGTQTYLDTETSKVVTGLSIGVTYYFMAWGETAGAYSSSNTTVMVTTLAGNPAATNLPAPATPNNWFQAPDYTNMVNTPFYTIVNFAADAFEMPKGTLWYMCALFFCVAVGVFFYSTVGNANLFLSVCAVGAMMLVCSAIKLVPMWQIIPFGVFAAVGIFVGERR